MKRMLFLVASAVLLAACGGDPSDADLDEAETAIAGGTARTHVIKVGPKGSPMTFAPSSLRVKPGDTVKWVWETDFHSVTSGNGSTGKADGKFCSDVKAPSAKSCEVGPLADTGATYSFTFKKKGTFPYFCRAHYPGGMKGSVVVR